uniref:Uncharacterized protein n=1 Tax=Caenorhabditis japonica TaxID=281687 RepID=A0A8R1E585_CAEJA
MLCQYLVHVSVAGLNSYNTEVAVLMTLTIGGKTNQNGNILRSAEVKIRLKNEEVCKVVKTPGCYGKNQIHLANRHVRHLDSDDRR